MNKTNDHVTLISLYVDNILIAGSDPDYKTTAKVRVL